MSLAKVAANDLVAHPQVHAQIEIAQDKDRGLELLGVFERAPAELKALGHAGRQQHDLPRIAVAEEVCEQQIALARARGQAGARPNAGDVPDDARNFREVRQPRELRHQADTGAAGRGHRARAGPTRPDNRANRGDFVFGLHDGDGILAGPPEAGGVDPVGGPAIAVAISLPPVIHQPQQDLIFIFC